MAVKYETSDRDWYETPATREFTTCDCCEYHIPDSAKLFHHEHIKDADFCSECCRDEYFERWKEEKWQTWEEIQEELAQNALVRA